MTINEFNYLAFSIGIEMNCLATKKETGYVDEKEHIWIDGTILDEKIANIFNEIKPSIENNPIKEENMIFSDNDFFETWRKTEIDELIKDHKGTIENELLWQKGSSSKEEYLMHKGNIQLHQKYIELLKKEFELFKQVLEKNNETP